MKEFLESLKGITVDIAEGVIAITLLILIGVAIATVGGVLIAFASTGLGAIIILGIVYCVYRNNKEK